VTARPALAGAAIVAALIGSAALARPSVWGNFTAKAPSAGNSITAATDFRAPTASGSVIGKTSGGVTGQIKKGGTYYVYAKATDTGNPASGVSKVTANVSTITSGSTTVALSAGTFSAGGVSYGYRSAALTAGSALAAGSYTYSLTLTDVAGNSKTQTGFTVTVDNTAPAGTDVQTVNASTTSGLAEAGDKISFSFSKAIDPNSVLSGWSGGATTVVVRLNDGVSGANDTVTVYNATNATQLPLGSVTLGGADYTGANLTFGATGTASSMTMSGNTITITLGTQSAAATTAAATGAMTWTPSATATDPAGNAASTAAVTESGTADKEF
jgi:Bacterial Ig-like domain